MADDPEQLRERTRAECAALREQAEQELQQAREQIAVEVARLEESVAALHTLEQQQQQKVKLDVGGVRYSTSVLTLQRVPGSYLALMFSGRFEMQTDPNDGTVFIDRDGTLFLHILNYLRDPVNFSLCRANLNNNDLAQLALEADFYGLREHLFEFYKLDLHAASILGRVYNVASRDYMKDPQGREADMLTHLLRQNYGSSSLVTDTEVTAWMKSIAFRMYAPNIPADVLGTFIMTKMLSPDRRAHRDNKDSSRDNYSIAFSLYAHQDFVSPVWQSTDSTLSESPVRLYKNSAHSFVVADATVSPSAGMHTRISEERKIFVQATLKTDPSVQHDYGISGKEGNCPLQLFFNGKGDQLQWSCSRGLEQHAIDGTGACTEVNSTTNFKNELVPSSQHFSLSAVHRYSHGPVGLLE